jgi:hypothetical protein
MSANIDQLTPTKSLIDLSRYNGTDFALPDYVIDTLFDDLLLVEYTDLSPDGNAVKRGGIFIPLSSTPRAWRVGRVVIAGSGCSNVSEGSLVVFPNDHGIPVTNMQYSKEGSEDINVVANGVFLNEERLFGVCSPIDIDDEDSSTDTTGTS